MPAPRVTLRVTLLVGLLPTSDTLVTRPFKGALVWVRTPDSREEGTDSLADAACLVGSPRESLGGAHAQKALRDFTNSALPLSHRTRTEGVERSGQDESCPEDGCDGTGQMGDTQNPRTPQNLNG